MKIAVPTRNNMVDDHFGHCELFTIFISDGKGSLKKTGAVPSLQGCGCKSNIVSVLKAEGVDVMLAGNMGSGALNVLRSHGIEVYRGCSGNVDLLAESFVQGNIEDSGEGCHENHGANHSCSH